MNGEEPPFKRRRPMTMLMLPDDLLYNCLARVSRLDYSTLSLVSKRFCSLLASKELYQTRTLLGRTETCLYVRLSLSTDTNQLRLFTLSRIPYSSQKTLIPIPTPISHRPVLSDVAVVGPNIYVTGGLIHMGDVKSTPSSRVMVMDCRSHEWREAPSMLVPRVFQSVCVLDGKIYVTGGCEKLDSTNWMEVYDTKTQIWKFLDIPSEEICKGVYYQSFAYEGALYVRSEEKNVTYKLHKGRWRAADLAMNRGLSLPLSHCVVKNVFFRYSQKTLDWYDSNKRSWTSLKGLEILSPMLSRKASISMTDYGGKMMVLWEECRSADETRIWCAEIAIEKRENGEIWGMLEWFDIVLTANEPYILECALATTI